MSHTVTLRTSAFLNAVHRADFHSDYAVARAMGVNRSTVTRVLRGDLQPGTTFIAGALVALAPMAFEDLFQVTRQPGKSKLGTPASRPSAD